jgi:hypothetical protein
MTLLLVVKIRIFSIIRFINIGLELRLQPRTQGLSSWRGEKRPWVRGCYD